MGGCPLCSEERQLASGRKLDEERRRLKAEKKAAQQARMEERNRKRKEKRLEKARRKAEREAQIAAKKAERERQKQLQAEERKRKEAEALRQRGLKWIGRAKEIHGDKFDYTETTFEKKEYHGKMRWVLANIKCPVHGYFDSRPEVHVVQKCGCPTCAGFFNFVPVEERKARWVARCQKKYNDRFDYSQFEYVDNDTKGIIICREHQHAYEQTPWAHLRDAGGCPFCNGSEGEVHIRTWLENHDIQFIPQYQIPNENLFCKRQYLVSDFWLPDYNLFIEMNGLQHYKYIAHFHDGKGRWTFEDQQIRDETFRKYCQDHRYNLLEIKYDQINKIPQILERTLKKYAH